MKRLNKISIFILIGIFLHQTACYSTSLSCLRVPLGSSRDIKEIMVRLHQNRTETLEMRHKRILGILSKVGEEHLLNEWNRLNDEQKGTLLDSIEECDWELFKTAKDDVKRKEQDPPLDLNKLRPKQPILEKRTAAAEAGDRHLRWGASIDPLKDRSRIGVLSLQGGGWRRGRDVHMGAKGTCPNVTPLSGETFIETTFDMIRSASQYYSHSAIFPVGFMVSNETEKEIIEYVRNLPEWEQVKNRVIFVRQKLLPLIDAKTGKTFLKREDRIASGGAGHGDAFEYVLNPDARAKGVVWSDAENGFVEVEVVKWYQGFGVEDVFYMNCDSLLYPFADRYFVGEHVLSGNKQKEQNEKKAHITHVMVEKESPAENLGNVLLDQDGNIVAVDYKNTTDLSLKAACKYGDCSISIVNIESLKGSKMSAFTLENPKPDTKAVGGRDIPIEIRKFERSSRNTPRASNCVELGFSKNPNDPVNRYDVFVEVKNADQLVEGRKVQSAHWKKMIRTALPGIHIPDTAVFELKKLARVAQFMSLDELKARLEAVGLASYMEDGVEILFSDDFSVISLSLRQRLGALPKEPSDGV